MKLIDSKKREQLYFELLNERYGPFPEPLHDDRPDFLIRFPDAMLGLECTEIYSQDKIYGVPRKQHEAIKDGIVEKAKQHAIANNVPPLKVSVIFTADGIQKHREASITHGLVRAVLANYPTESGERIIGGFDSDYPLPEEVHCVFVARFPASRKHLWDISECGDTETDFSRELQGIINSKAQKLAVYLKRCDKCWLLIAAKGSGVSSFYEPSEEVLDYIYRSPFERVFFMEASSRFMAELKIKQSWRT